MNRSLHKLGALTLRWGFLSMLLAQCVDATGREPIALTDRAREMHQRLFLVDGHNDMPWELRSQDATDFNRIDISQRQDSLHTDIPRLRQGGVDAQFWSVWVPTKTAKRGAALLTTLEQIELVEAMVARYPQDFALAYSAADIRKHNKAGRIASLIGVEGGHCIEESLANLERLYKLGARYMTLTHSDTLSWADSATDEFRNGGLTEFGRDVVRKMNQLGMMVDLSHVSPDTMHQALDTTAAPVIFSHSSCRAVADHPRNVPDDVLRRLPRNGGLVMINFFSAFVVSDAAEVYKQRFALKRELDEKHGDDETTIRRELARWSAKHPMPTGDIHHVLDHIDHVVNAAGVDHVGIGSDFDGVSVLPKQLEDVSCYPYLTQGMLDRGYDEQDIAKILGKNLMRVFQQTEAIAMQPAQENAAPVSGAE